MGISEQEQLKACIERSLEKASDVIQILTDVREFIDNRDKERERARGYLLPPVDNYEPNYEEMSKEDVITYCEFLKLKQHPIKWTYIE